VIPIVEDDFSKTSLAVLPIDKVNDMIIYPNPTADKITIEYYQFAGDEKVILFDITGKPLLNCNLQGITSNIDISTFS